MMPLAELRLHIGGPLEADLLVALARRDGVPLTSHGPAELTARYADFADLQAFLDVYYANLAVLRTAQDFADLAAAYLRRTRAAGVRRAGSFFSPPTPPARGGLAHGAVRGSSAPVRPAAPARF